MEFIAKIDFAILDFIQYYLKNDILDIPMKYITYLGDVAILWIVIAVLLLLQKSKRKYGIMMIIALLMSVIICNGILKPVIGRIRPYDVNNEIFDSLLISPPEDYSFPSGHTLASFACVAILLHYNKKRGIFWTIIASLIAFSRIYLYVHYPTDIIVGVILGLIIGNISKKLYYFVENKKIKRIFKRNNILFQRIKQEEKEMEENTQNNEQENNETIDNKEIDSESDDEVQENVEKEENE